MDYAIPFLKYLAIFVSAVSGCLALLVDFKKNGKPTLWGKVALFTVIISFLISAILQSVELQNNKATETAENNKTQLILKQISRGIYFLRAPEIKLDLRGTVNCKDDFFKPYVDRIKRAIANYEINSKRLKGTQFNKIGFWDLNTHKSGNTNSYTVRITPSSPLYPNITKEGPINKVLGRIALEVYIDKPSEGKLKPISKKGNNLINFETLVAKPTLTYNSLSETLDFSIDDSKVDDDTYFAEGSNSLVDLPNATLVFRMSTSVQEDLSDAAFKASKAIKFNFFNIRLGPKTFYISDPCSTPKDYPDYYAKFPKDVTVSNELICTDH